MSKRMKRYAAHTIFVLFAAMLLAAFMAPQVVTWRVVVELYLTALAVMVACYIGVLSLSTAARWLDESEEES